ncbi:hypothetical protein HHI36_006841 [Cryptolaemus montrouzieri]|uniref:Caspase-3 n=1 Tax=Cryptolaemus montrouzieri TaxID=559131 RepID=A0ABD2MN85_9CUCU
MAKKFPNTNCDNTYDTKSMKRGQVLIINNKFFNPPHKVRTGSEIDLKCLRELFKQMHMEVEFHEDLDKSQMEQVILQFAKFDAYKISDICIIVIMSHGTEREKEQVVLDRYGQGLKTSWIEDQFNNVNCTLFSGKPKVLLYQLCRGKQPDFATTKIKDKEDATNDPNVVFTETDRNQNNAGLVETDSGLIFQTERRLEDMLVGYATQRGRQAHRDPILGSWYIQLICEVLMEKAHDTQLIEMLNEVDRKMKMLSSQDYTMQTSSYTSNGFNKSLYFNPGIYLDASGNVQKFI